MYKSNVLRLLEPVTAIFYRSPATGMLTEIRERSDKGIEYKVRGFVMLARFGRFACSRSNIACPRS